MSATVEVPAYGREVDDGATCTSCGDLCSWSASWCGGCGARLLPASCYAAGWRGGLGAGS